MGQLSDAPVNFDSREKQFQILVEQSASTFLAVFSLSAALIYMVWNHFSHGALLCWGTFVYALAISRIGLMRKFKAHQAKGDREQVLKLGKLAIWGICLSGISWGIGVAAFFPPSSQKLQLFIAMLTAGMCAGAVGSYSVNLKAVYSFLIPFGLTFSARVAWMGTKEYYVLAFATTLFTIILLQVAKRFNIYINQYLVLAYQNQGLIDQLTAHNHSLQRSNRVMFDGKKQLLHSSRLQALGEMSAGLAHEINNPLAIIKGAAQLISRRASQDNISKEELLAKTSTIEKTTNRIAKIVEALRTFARDDRDDDRTPTEIATIVEQTLELCHERFKNNNVLLKVELKANPVVHCHSVQISQVLINLLNNAFDAVRGTENAWLKIESELTGNDVLLSVTDSGKGIDRGVEALIFEPFFTTKGASKGTGLGLSLSKGILESHEGTLFVDRTSPNTRFVMRLPLNQVLKATA